MSKSHVAMGHYECPVCLKKHNESVLLDKRLKDSFEEKEYLLGYDLCPEHQKLYEDGYIALIEVDENKLRTGCIAHLRKTVFDQMFDIKTNSPVVLCEQAVIDQLKEQTQNENRTN